MANLLKLFCDVNSKKLVMSPFDSSIYSLPAFYNGDKVPVELQLLLPNSRGGLSSKFSPLSEATSVELGLVTVADSPTERAAIVLTQKYKMWSVNILQDGSGWSVGDTATVTTTSADEAATVLITGVDDTGQVTSVEILKEGIITTTGSHPATGVTTTKQYYNDAGATGLTLRVVWAGIHTGVLDLNTTAFDTWLGSDLTKETTFEIRAWSGSDWDQTVFQTTATVKQEGFV
jgi:hypothetical protein